VQKEGTFADGGLTCGRRAERIPAGAPIAASPAARRARVLPTMAWYMTGTRHEDRVKGALCASVIRNSFFIIKLY